MLGCTLAYWCGPSCSASGVAAACAKDQAVEQSSGSVADLNQQFTEEDARVAVSRWLESIGHAPGDLQFEVTFPIRVGRLARDVDGRPLAQDGTLRPRCDILIRHEQRPIAIAEIKRPGTEFDDDDREQGLSYAALTRPITPLVILTDGCKSEVLLATGERYDPRVVGDIIDGRKLPADIAPGPDEIFDALRLFLRLDQRNVREFCAAQRAFRSEGLVAPDNLPASHVLGRYKYLPKTYVARDQANDALAACLEQQQKLVLPVLSAAGVGKTSFLLDRCEWLTEQSHLVFFLNGVRLQEAPLAAIREDLHWQGVSIADDVRLLERLVRLVPDNGRLVFVIDAIDECQSPQLALQLDQLAGHLQAYADKTCLIVGCKMGEWVRFSSIRGEPSRLDTQAYRPLSLNEPPDALSPPGIRLEEFSSSEVDSALSVMSGWIARDLEPLPDDIRQHCRTGYFLHMLAKVRLASDGWPPPLRNESLHSLFFRDLARRVDPSGRPERTEDLLVQVARRCWEQASVSGIASADVSDLATANGDRLLALFDRGVLTGTMQRVGFYFQPFLLWLVADRILGLPRLEPREFVSVAAGVARTPLGAELLHSYLAGAPAEQREALAEDLEGKGRVYLAFRDDLIRRHFTDARQLLEPFSSEVGVLLNPDGVRALFRRRGAEPHVVVSDAPTDGLLSVPAEYRGRVGTVRQRFPDPIVMDPETAALSEVFEEIVAVAKAGAWLQETQRSASELVRALWRCLSGRFEKPLQFDLPLPELDVEELTERACLGYAFEQRRSAGIEAALGFRPTAMVPFQGGMVAATEERGVRREKVFNDDELRRIDIEAQERAREDVAAGIDLGWPASEDARAYGALFNACRRLALLDVRRLPAESYSPHRFARQRRSADELSGELLEIAQGAAELEDLILKRCLPNFRAWLPPRLGRRMYVGPEPSAFGGLSVTYLESPQMQGVEVLPGPAPALERSVGTRWGRTSVTAWTDGEQADGTTSLWSRRAVPRAIEQLTAFTPIRNVAHSEVREKVENLVRGFTESERLTLRSWIYRKEERRKPPLSEIDSRCFTDVARRQLWTLLQNYPDTRPSELVVILGRAVRAREELLNSRRELELLTGSGEFLANEPPEVVEMAAMRVRNFGAQIYLAEQSTG